MNALQNTNAASLFENGFKPVVLELQPPLQEQPWSSRLSYLEDSEIYHLRGGFTAEVIQNPFARFLQKSIVNEVVRDLTRVTMSAFEKTMDQIETYAPEHVIMKNGVMVDWLTVVREGTKVIAYAASSYLNEEKAILYFNATIVDKDYQSKGALGSINHMYILEKILSQRNDHESHSLSLVTRTRNRNVAKLMDSVLFDMRISGAETLAEDDRRHFITLARLLGSQYDPETGINKDVYPKGLPDGSEKPGDKVNNIFLKLGECDAFLISGRINYDKICKFLKHEVKNPEPVSLTRELQPLAQAAA